MSPQAMIGDSALANRERHIVNRRDLAEPFVDTLEGDRDARLVRHTRRV
jgi:hypothetical protein